ncbi:unnamed protein product, partial [Effrenium voratum]
MDLSLHESHNIMSSHGFANMVWQVCRLRPGSGKFTAPVCSTWVFLSRSSTGRSAARPLGWTSRECVAGRVLVLLLIAHSIQVWWVLEQPLSSVMHLHPLFQAMLKLPTVQVKKLYTAMGWFGGPTLKPTHLYSSHDEIDDLNKLANKGLMKQKEGVEMVRKYVDGSGRRRVAG